MSTDSLHIVCPACLAVNRVPLSRLEAAPRCGGCHGALFLGRPMSVDEAGFQRLIERSDQPVLVDFWAPWCAPCRGMAAHLDAAAQKLEPHVRVAKIDVEAHQVIGARHNIRSLPTLAVFHGGQEISRHQGAIGAGEIVRFTAEALR